MDLKHYYVPEILFKTFSSISVGVGGGGREEEKEREIDWEGDNFSWNIFTFAYSYVYLSGEEERYLETRECCIDGKGSWIEISTTQRLDISHQFINVFWTQ